MCAAAPIMTLNRAGWLAGWQQQVDLLAQATVCTVLDCGADAACKQPPLLLARTAELQSDVIQTLKTHSTLVSLPQSKHQTPRRLTCLAGSCRPIRVQEKTVLAAAIKENVLCCTHWAVKAAA